MTASIMEYVIQMHLNVSVIRITVGRIVRIRSALRIAWEKITAIAIKESVIVKTVTQELHVILRHVLILVLTMEDASKDNAFVKKGSKESIALF